ncbi:MAG: hypothetical protein ACE14P_09565 [Methanotrichaceae archaeon]
MVNKANSTYGINDFIAPLLYSIAMLNDMESAMALVEGQKLEAVSAVKDEWHLALEEASKMLKWPDKFIVQYNPAIWRRSHYPVGMRLLSDPFKDYLIFEFATPNYILPFDCFEFKMAKIGVMLHEFSHLIDDERWSFDLSSLAIEAGEFITREQRAELLAFACCPIGVFEANLALIKSTARMLGVELGRHSQALAAIETMGHAGLAGGADPIEVFKEAKADGVPADKIIEHYLCTFSFSMAGLTTTPDLNESQGLGIKRSKDLTQANKWLCQHLKGEVDLSELQMHLEDIGYYAFSEEGYDPLGCLDFTFVDRMAAKENISHAKSYFMEEPYFSDLLNATETLLKNLK